MEKKNSMSKIFEKVKEFIHKYIVKKEDTKLLEAPKSVEVDKKEENKNFKETIQIKENQNIQEKYEREETTEEELPIIELMNLIQKYKREIKELKLNMQHQKNQLLVKRGLMTEVKNAKSGNDSKKIPAKSGKNIKSIPLYAAFCIK